MSTAETRDRSNWWYLLPIFFSIFGGLISYFAIRHDDPKKARNCLIVGIVLFVIPIVVPLIMMGTLGTMMHDDDFFFEMREEFYREFGSEFPIMLPGDEFTISYTKEGGIAGIRQAITIDSDKMMITDGIDQIFLEPPSQEELEELKDAIENSNFFRIVTGDYPPPEDSADHFSYSLRITFGGQISIYYLDRYLTRRSRSK